MSLSLYDISIPSLVRGLANLRDILDKGEAHLQANGGDPVQLLDSRLAPDMFPLTRQVQIATDAAKSAGARLAGQEVPSYPDTETSFDELRARIDRTIAYLRSLDRADIDGQEGRTVVMKMPTRTLTFTGSNFLLQFALPHFYFHVTTAYALIRHVGAPLSKQDYLKGMDVVVTEQA